jgi:ParB-like chromosome segregation protein Spo0J
MGDWSRGEIQFRALDRFDERYGCYRLPAREAEAEMVSSLRQFGQLSPRVCRWEGETPSVIDGFRRLHAARQIAGLAGLTTRLIEIDEREANVAIYRLNQVGRRVHVLEEAWLVYALVREDGLSQLEVAQLMGRHKSWVCRRLALPEKLAPLVRQDLQLGRLSPTAARSLTRLPAGNQEEVLEAARRESLTAAEVRGVVELLLSSSTREQKEFVLEKPRQALSQARGGPTRSWDPRLSTAGNRVARKLGGLLDSLAGMENWLRYRGRGELLLWDVGILSPGFERLARDSQVVGELAGDFVEEMKLG